MGTEPHGEASLEAMVARLTNRLDTLEQREMRQAHEHREKVAQLEAANAALRDEVAVLRSAQVAPAAASRMAEGRAKRLRALRTSRRKLLRLGGAAAAASVAAGMLAADRGGMARAASARADTVTLPVGAMGSGNIAIEGDGTSGAQGVVGTSDSNIGVLGQSGSGIGVQGLSTSNTGVYGVASGSGFGMLGTSTSGAGGYFDGGRAPLQLGLGAISGAPSSGAHSPGEIYLDHDAAVWVCVGPGTPGSWARLAGVLNGSSGGAVTFLPIPIRLLDTRPGATGAAATPGTKIQPGVSNTFHLSVAGASFGGVTVPSNAKALVGNCTVVNPAGVGDLAAYPDGQTLPNTAVMHYLTDQIVSNGIVIGLGTNGKLAITALTSATDVIIDCQGIII